MKEQSYSNHKRYHPLYHFIMMPLSLTGLIGSLINLSRSSADNSYNASLLVLVFLMIAFLTTLVRLYALKVQNRVIRTEVRFRHYELTGKPLDPALRLGQIIALRFASDEELPALATRAANEKLSSSDIKKSIKNWRADHHRV